MGIQGRDHMRDRPLFEDGERPSFIERRTPTVVAIVCAVLGLGVTLLGVLRTIPARDAAAGDARARSQEVLDAQAIGGFLLGGAAAVLGIWMLARGRRGAGVLALVLGAGALVLAVVLEAA